jgi:hypothetical protein
MSIICISTLYVFAENVIIVNNPEVGILDDEKNRYFEWTEDLVIGKEDGESNEMLGRIFDVATDSDGNIYILDAGFFRIVIFSSDGSFLRSVGRKGEGPGELIFPTALAVGEQGNIYVGDRGKVVIFKQSGDYSFEMKIDEAGGFNLIRSIRVGSRDDIFISCFDVYKQNIIHNYSLEHGLLVSFCESYAKGKDEDVRIENVVSGGSIDTDTSGNIYFTQMHPYEIRKYTQGGELKMIIHRKNDFMVYPEVEISETRFRIGSFAASYSIVVLANGNILNVVKLPYDMDNEERPNNTIVDIFNSQGQFMTSKTFNRDINVICVDADGRFYVIDTEEYPRVVRYKYSFDN